MKVLDLSLPSPAENLAGDEALLDAAETGMGDAVLRFWEAPQYFVVVGYANKVAAEVNVPACEARQVPVLRRCSGGGTVLQGPGCLNYALVLRITPDGPTRNISTANEFIMARNRDALQSVLGHASPTIAIQGHTDLALGDRKFSGNAQRRRRDFLLFHGTFLLNFDLALVGECLLLPTLQPDYRARRSHGEFITNLERPAASVKAALCAAWDVTAPAAAVPRPLIRKLVDEKYSNPEWNRKS